VISVALVGCAHIHTPKFVSMLQARDDISVKAVWDHDSDRAMRNADNLSASAVSELSSIWDDDEIHAVIICSETIHHHALVSAALDAGMHLFVEKPLAIGGADAAAMADAIEQSGRIFSTGFFMRGRALHRFVREEIATGSFGRIIRLDVAIGHPGALEGWFDDEWHWMTEPSRSGYGGLGDLGIHGVDLVLWLLGHRSEPLRVTAWTGSTGRRYGDIDEYGRAQLDFSDGMVANVWGSWADLANPVRLIVSGTDAHASIVDGRLSYRRVVGGKASEIPIDGIRPDLPHAFQLFLDAIAGDADAELVLPAQAARCSIIIEAAYRSARIFDWLCCFTGNVQA
jgi:predicted dehydrogenase